MRRHIVVYVKSRDLQAFIEKLDSKGWAVMDIEPKTRINVGTIVMGLISAICIMLHVLHAIDNKVAPYIAAFLIVGLIVSFAFSFVVSYTVVCEYIGNDEYIDMTPYDDTDNDFVKNDFYVPTDDAEQNNTEASTSETTENNN